MKSLPWNQALSSSMFRLKVTAIVDGFEITSGTYEMDAIHRAVEEHGCHAVNLSKNSERRFGEQYAGSRFDEAFLRQIDF